MTYFLSFSFSFSFSSSSCSSFFLGRKEGGEGRGGHWFEHEVQTLLAS